MKTYRKRNGRKREKVKGWRIHKRKMKNGNRKTEIERKY